MSHPRSITIQICRRAAYLMFNNSVKHSKVASDRSSYMIRERELLNRCYQIS
ncbi:MAG: hypothetical protein AAGE84_02925 [Cyanobacteria bacterium P01_G01_bin.39]